MLAGSLSATALLIVVLTIPQRLALIYRYHRIAATLKQPGPNLGICELPAESEESRFLSLGYATVNAQCDVPDFDIVGRQGILLDCEGFSTVFFPPFAVGRADEATVPPNPSHSMRSDDFEDLKKDLRFAVAHNDQKRIESIMSSFDGELMVAKTTYVSDFKLFWLNHGDAEVYLALLAAKAVGPQAIRRIDSFINSKGILGLVYWPTAVNSAIEVHIWSRRGFIAQGIRFAANGREDQEKLLKSLLASFDYQIEEVPPGAELETMIQSVQN